jgi:hypothetical protein
MADVPMMEAEAGPALRVLIILDITASMGAEISAVKSAVAEMVGLCSDMAAVDPDEAEEQLSLAFAFITFTEDNTSGCHVSPLLTSPGQAVAVALHPTLNSSDAAMQRSSIYTTSFCLVYKY